MKVSVIIPTLNEAGVLERTLRQARILNPHEIVVVDGGSTDATEAIARREGAVFLTAFRGRSSQLNAAAGQARGDVLLFLHADCSLEAGGYRCMLEALLHPRRAGGAFLLHIESDDWLLRFISACANWRARNLNLVYGDQAMFVRAEVFRRMGGFSALPICEDLDFFRRLRRQGEVVLLDAEAKTSPRRWLREGIVFTTLRNLLIAGLFLLGFSPRALSRFYPEIR